MAVVWEVIQDGKWNTPQNQMEQDFIAYGEIQI